MRLRFAYADPPYVGMAGRYDHPDTLRWNDPAEHVALMAQMDADYDGCAKPEAFARWLLVLLGWQPGDEVVDLFPGTGVIGRIAGELRLPLDEHAEQMEMFG